MKQEQLGDLLRYRMEQAHETLNHLAAAHEGN